MRLVVQRVTSAEVEADGQVVGRIGPGLLVYVGVAHGDGADQASRMAEKGAGRHWAVRPPPNWAGRFMRCLLRL
jgi:D-Tyr-tRNAtyr deacylase